MGGFEGFLVNFASSVKKDRVGIVSRDKKFFFRLASILSVFYGKSAINDIPKLDPKKLPENCIVETESFTSLGKALSKYDVIYSKNELLEVVTLRVLGLFYDLPPIVYGVHTTITYPSPHTFAGIIHNLIYGSRLYLKLINSASGIHVLNAETQHYFTRSFPSKSVFVSHNAIDSRVFYPEVKIANLPGKFKIIWVGRLSEQKGVEELINIIKLVNVTKRSDVEWHIVGAGMLSPLVHSIVSLENNVIYHGVIPSNDLARILPKMDLFVSTSKWEEMPLSIIEALMCNIPVVAFDISGIRDVINTQKLGVLVKNIDEFVITIHQIMESEITFNNVHIIAKRRYSFSSAYPKLHGFIRTFAVPRNN